MEYNRIKKLKIEKAIINRGKGKKEKLEFYY
jgi:hypothetical protein